MLVFREKVDFTIEYPLEKFSSKDRILFFDIETTGFSREKCFIYLIGCMYYVGDVLMYTQWLAENRNDEANVLMAFHKFMQPFNTIIHFNGNSFDIPFVVARGQKIHLDFSFEKMQSVDIYKPVSKLNHLIGLENNRLKTYETFLSIQRVDPFSGGELVVLYQEYLRTKDGKLLLPLLMHNKEDVLNMGKLISLLSIPDLLSGNYSLEHYTFVPYEDHAGNQQVELQIQITPNTGIPAPISYQYNGLYFRANQNRVQITVQQFSG
jgi:uncharacterized protein YprB with RNaseH-like and TPR domain